MLLSRVKYSRHTGGTCWLYGCMNRSHLSRLSNQRYIFECGPARPDPRWRVTSRRRESDRASVKFAPARRQFAPARKPRWRADEPRQRAFRAGKRQSAPARGSRWRGFRHAGAPISRWRAELHAGARILSCYGRRSAYSNILSAIIRNYVNRADISQRPIRYHTTVDRGRTADAAAPRRSTVRSRGDSSRRPGPGRPGMAAHSDIY